MSYDGGDGRSRVFSGRLLIAVIIAGFSLLSYLGHRVYNPVTGQTQHLSISPQQEIALGLQSEPMMTEQYGGLDPDAAAQARVKRVGQQLVDSGPGKDSAYKFDYHLLADNHTVNAFALPGGPVFITRALYDKLKTDGQLAGVLGHETGHVLARHSAQQLAKQQLTQGLSGAAVLATYDPQHGRGGQSEAIIAALVGNLVNMKFSRADETQADTLGVRFMAEAGYDPRAMLKVMEILRDEAKGGHQPEFFSTHPDPGNRLEVIQAEITKTYPNGVPAGLKP